MKRIHLRIGKLRRQKAVSQQVLADALGVAFQTVSKWENETTMPDITLLPEIADFFEVSVDQLLGLKPLPGEQYIPVESGSAEYWNERLDYLKRTRKYIWNQDYMEFLVEKVWRPAKPADMLDCGCGWGFLASCLFPLLAKGSSYTGVDQSEKLTQEAERMLGGENIRFVCEDFMEYKTDKKYDVVICQTLLRHIGQPGVFLEKMVSMCKKGGIVICIDVNREVESDGLYIEGMDYSYLCSRPGFRKKWNMELEKQDRDYAVGIRLPEMMVRAGLSDVECRMNDKVNFISTQRTDYEEAVQDLMETRGWSAEYDDRNETAAIEGFMNHGMTRSEAEEFCRKQRRIESWMKENRECLSIAAFGGLMISYGRKRG